MICEVIGIKELNFKASNGSVINGKHLYITYESENVIGKESDKIFISADKNLDISVGDRIQVFYNKKGKIQNIEIII